MPRSQNRDFAQGPIWDANINRWLAEIAYPDNTRARKRFRRQRDAQIWWAARRKAIEDGSWQTTSKPNRFTLAEAVTQYPEHSQAHHRSSSTYVENGLSVFENALGSKTPLKDITTADLERLKLNRLQDDKVAKATVDKNIAVAKSFFSWCILQGLTSSNPAKKVKLFHEDKERVRFLDPETEYPKLLVEAKNGPWYLAPLIVLDLNTGLRRRNILNLRWDQVDFKRRIIRIESRTKSGRPHNLPLNDTAFQKLQELLRRPVRIRTSSSTWREDLKGNPSPISRTRLTQRSLARRSRTSDFTIYVTHSVPGLRPAAFPSQRSKNWPVTRRSR